MSRLQKKCFLASIAMHSLLVVALVFGTAFLTHKELKDPMRTITMIPRNVVDSLVSGGGGTPPPPAPAPVVETPRVAEVAPPPPPVEVPKPVIVPPTPPPPAPAPAVEPVVVHPPPAVEPRRPAKAIDHVVTKKAKETKAKSAPIETVSTPKTTAKATETKSTPKVDLSKAKVVARDSKVIQEKADQERREQQAAADRAAKRRADQIAGLNSALGNLKENLSTGVSVEPVGGDGAGFANYLQILGSIYQNECDKYRLSDDVSDKNAIVQVQVTVARDGRVVATRILVPSGNSTVNKHVQRVLDTIKKIVPFPEGSKDLERTFNVDFNLKPKRLTG